MLFRRLVVIWLIKSGESPMIAQACFRLLTLHPTPEVSDASVRRVNRHSDVQMSV